MSIRVTCPECKATGTKIIDVEIRGVYDGCLFHGCLECDATFHRKWVNEGVTLDMQRRAAPYMEHGLRAVLNGKPLPPMTSDR